MIMKLIPFVLHFPIMANVTGSHTGADSMAREMMATMPQQTPPAMKVPL